MGVSDLFNNTVLIPYHDSLTDSNHDLESPKIVDDLETYITQYNKLSRQEKRNQTVLENQFGVKIISYASESSSDTKQMVTSDVGLCQGVEGLQVTRSVKKSRSGGEALYEIKVPEMISYGEVTLKHLYTNSKSFLDWLINGADQGGALLADIEIKVGDNANGWVVYTLRDAFPIKWRLGSMGLISVDAVRKRKTMQAKDGSVPLEEVTLVYGRLDYSLESGNSGS